VTSNADYVCRYCGHPVSVQEDGEWGHTNLVLYQLRFWCVPQRKLERVEPASPNGSYGRDMAINSESVFPESVTAMMTDDPMMPTAPLEDFLVAMAIDDNTWWRVGCGHHLNLFDAACERAGLM
jgi:hypothetical protein